MGAFWGGQFYLKNLHFSHMSVDNTESISNRNISFYVLGIFHHQVLILSHKKENFS